MTLSAALLLALAPAVGVADPVPAPLSPGPPAGGGVEEPARALPAVVTICRARAEPTRCWVRTGEDTCAPDGEPFRVVLDQPVEVASALEACRLPDPVDGASLAIGAGNAVAE